MPQLDQIKEYLKTLDEVQLCELLGITAEDIINRFSDIISRKRRELESELEILDSSYEDDDDSDDYDYDNE